VEAPADAGRLQREMVPDERNASLNYLDWFQNTADVYNYRNKKYSLRMQSEGGQRRAPPAYMANPFTCNGECFSIRIDRSTFREFGAVGMRTSASPAFVKQNTEKASAARTYQGKVLNLDNFQGPISISDSQFSSNQLAYAGCTTFENVEDSASQKNRLNLKSVISVRRHQN
jgi:hypothetical protein